ncbi:MAG: biotin--[acetyl-CoA-carboxylase] ligase [bacterium]
MILDETVIRRLLKTRSLGHKIYLFDVIGSTNDFLFGLAQKGCSDGTVVITDKQTSGRGRFGRRWFSPKGGGIWMSFLIKGVNINNGSPLLSLSIAIGVCDAIKSIYKIDLSIKWPNDITYKKKKLVGILLEQGICNDGEGFIVCGIGINTDFTTVKVPDDIRESVISLNEIVDRFVDRNILISEILNNLEFIIDRFKDNSLDLKSLLFGKDCFIGSDIIWSDSGKFIEGEIIGFREDGALIVNSGGVEHYLLSGSIIVL